MKLSMLDEALGYYDFTDNSAEFIRHNENMTYRIGRKYLLRIHEPRDGFSTEPMYDGIDSVALHQSELEYLKYLGICGLNVQAPVCNRAGELVTILADGTPATVLTWLEGHTIEKDELTPMLGHEIGELAGKLYLAARAYGGNCAMRYDQALCGRMIDKLARLGRDGLLADEFGGVMAAALRTVGEFLSRSECEFVLVHSDLSLSNMLITEKGLAPIDFSLFGYSHPMLDIGGLFGCIGSRKLRQAITDGYEAATGVKVDFQAVDCCFALQVLLGIVLHFELWIKEDWFTGKLRGWCDKIFKPLATGEPVMNLQNVVIFATEREYPGWLALVSEVAENFPGLDLAEYSVTLQKNIARQTALCVKADGRIAGILIFSPNQHCLSCMAVHPDYRHRGIASALLARMLELMPTGDITVTTFRDGDEKGTAPRALYHKFGFVEAGLLTEFDYPVQRFILQRRGDD